MEFLCRGLVLLLAGLIPTLLSAQMSWQSVPGPEGLGDSILTSVRFRNTLYALPYDSYDVNPMPVYRTSDKGESWQEARWSMPVYPRRIFADSTGALIMLARDTHRVDRQYTLFRSTDHGKEWTPIHTVYDWMNSAGFLVLPDGSYLLGGSSPPLKRSFDYGKTWQNLQGATPADSFYFGCVLALRPDGRIYADFRVPTGPTTWKEVYWESTDMGETWSSRQGVEAIDYFFFDDSIYFTAEFIPVTHSPQRLCRHAGKPECERRRFETHDYNYGSLASDRAGYLYFVETYRNRTKGKIMRSSDRGVTWDTLKSLPSGFSPFRIEVVDESLIAFGHYGPFRSDDHGATWVTAHSGIDASPIIKGFHPFADGTILYTTLTPLTYRYSQLDRTYDLITNPLGLPLSDEFVETSEGVLVTHPGTADDRTLADLMLLSSGGMAFTLINVPPGTEDEKDPHPAAVSGDDRLSRIAMYIDDDDDLLVVERPNKGPAVYDFWGSGWHGVDTFRTGGPPYRYANYLTVSQRGYLLTALDSSFYRLSIDAINASNPEEGIWERVHDLGVPFRYPGLSSANDGDLLYLTQDSIIVSQDAGATWTPIPIPTRYVVDGLLSGNGELYIVTSPNGQTDLELSLYTTRLDQIDWQLVSFGTEMLTGLEIKESLSGDLYALINKERLYRLSVPTGVRNGMRVDGSHLRVGVMPNPTREELAVTLEAPAADRCAVRLFDLAGRSVLPSQEIESGGRIVFDVGHLPVGSYRCEVTSLTTGERTSSAVQVVR